MQFRLPKTISSLPFSPPNPTHTPRNKNPSLLLSLHFHNQSTITDTTDDNSHTNNSHNDLVVTERGLKFHTGDSFFRSESAVGRDLAVLSAALHKRSNQSLRVLDALCGCGVRSLRYLREAGADFVWANDANEEYRSTILSNLLGEVGFAEGRSQGWVVTHSDANRLLVERRFERDFFDLIDVDSFGSDSRFLRSAIEAVRIGGLVYATSTDGYSSGGHRPFHSLASYGAYVRPMPYSNEVGLRMLIGGALREAAVSGFHISPLFSYYSYHGPVFRVMFRVNRGKLPNNAHYGFISYCNRCGNSQTFPWDKLGHFSCPCSNGEVSGSLVVSGPLWTGPLHDGDYVAEMLKLAEEWGWAGTGTEGVDLKKLLQQMIDESDPDLPFGYIELDEIARRAKINCPPLRTIISTLKECGMRINMVLSSNYQFVRLSSLNSVMPVMLSRVLSQESSVVGKILTLQYSPFSFKLTGSSCKPHNCRLKGKIFQSRKLLGHPLTCLYGTGCLADSKRTSSKISWASRGRICC